jgi:hypothetical protein
MSNNNSIDVKGKKGNKVLTWSLISCGGCFSIFVVMGIISAIVAPSSDTKDDVVLENTQEIVEDVAVRVEVDEVDKEKEHNSREVQIELLIIDKLWLAFDESIKSRKGYDIEYVESEKLVLVTYYSDIHWSSQTMIKHALKDYIDYSQRAFGVDGIENVTLRYQGTFIDRYGDESIENAIVITLSKIEFEKYKWNNLKGQPIFERISDSAEVFFLHPSVMRDIDTAEIVYY